MATTIDYSFTNLVSYYVLCLTTIMFVVFMSSTQSFILTDVIGRHQKIVSLSNFLIYLFEIDSNIKWYY